MAVRVGAGLVGDVRLGSAQLSKVMVGTSQVWSAFTPWSASGTIGASSISGPTSRASTTIPYDMVADVSFYTDASATQFVAYPVLNGSTIGGLTGTTDSTYTRRVYLSAGTLAFWHNASFSTLAGSWSVTAVDTSTVPLSGSGDLYSGLAVVQAANYVVASCRVTSAMVATITFNGDWNANGTGYSRYLNIAKGTPSTIVATSAEGAETVSASGVSLAAGDWVYFTTTVTSATTARRVINPSSSWSIT